MSASAAAMASLDGIVSFNGLCMACTGKSGGTAQCTNSAQGDGIPFCGQHRKLFLSQGLKFGVFQPPLVSSASNGEGIIEDKYLYPTIYSIYFSV